MGVVRQEPRNAGMISLVESGRRATKLFCLTKSSADEV